MNLRPIQSLLVKSITFLMVLQCDHGHSVHRLTPYCGSQPSRWSPRTLTSWCSCPGAPSFHTVPAWFSVTSGNMAEVLVWLLRQSHLKHGPFHLAVLDLSLSGGQPAATSRRCPSIPGNHGFLSTTNTNFPYRWVSHCAKGPPTLVKPPDNSHSTDLTHLDLDCSCVSDPKAEPSS